ncbi:alpha/beta hydrolase [Eubacteriaceae bacterium ES2]|nr:alpha/beta hydrolase [Eubacteriaceae bacterium ES2]
MKKLDSKIFNENGIILNYYELKNDKQPLVMLHAQGVCALNFDNVFKALSKKYHIYAVDCYGHGASLHDKEKYNIRSIGDVIIRFIKSVINSDVVLLGHSSGGLLAAYIAAYSDVCEYLFLEDPPLFASQGERRFQTFNYIDLSSICKSYIEQKEQEDFVLYYFSRQKAWNFFPEKSRDKIREKMVEMAKKARKNNPTKDLKVPFWPKAALSAFKGMNQYDPYFGLSFYNDTFHANLSHQEMLSKINCRTIIMKAQTSYNAEGVLLAAMNEEDAARAGGLIKNSKIERFECGHGIHIEEKKQFVRCLINYM